MKLFVEMYPEVARPWFVETSMLVKVCVETYPEFPRPCIVEVKLIVFKLLKYPAVPRPWTVEVIKLESEDIYPICPSP
jgi:hypothetical protein